MGIVGDFFSFVGSMLLGKKTSSNEFLEALTMAERYMRWGSERGDLRDFQSAFDQSCRGLFPADGKPSRREAYFEQVAVKEFLSSHGLAAGERVAVLGNPPLYWARLSGLKIVGEILDPIEFLTAEESERARSIGALRAAGLKAVLGQGSALAKLAGDGWLRIPGTTSYHALLLTNARYSDAP